MASEFVDLDQIVEDWAWLEYDKTSSRRQKKLRKKDKKEPNRYLSLAIDWSKTKFVDETNWSPLRDDESDAGASASSVAVRGRRRRDLPRSSILFQTKFTNNTNLDQEYTMKTEKKTKTTVTTSVEQGFTRGVEMSVKLAAPCEVFEANAGYTREFSLTRSDAETFEEELTWGVESLIKVNKGHVAEASLVVDERKQSGDFTIVTRIRGRVYVTFTSPADNKSFFKSTSRDIGRLFEDFLVVERRKGRKLDFVEVKTEPKDMKTVIIQTKGNCRFRYGIKQEIKVDQKPLNSHS